MLSSLGSGAGFPQLAYKEEESTLRRISTIGGIDCGGLMTLVVVLVIVGVLIGLALAG